MGRNQPVNKGLLLALVAVAVIAVGYWIVQLKSSNTPETVAGVPKAPPGLTPVTEEEMRSGPQPMNLR